MFEPAEEIVRFVSRHLRRRVEVDRIVDVLPGSAGCAVLDLGCGMGRNMVYGESMGLAMHGIELSAVAVEKARRLLRHEGHPQACERVVQGDVRELPWSDGHFHHAISDSALDSMPFAIACEGVAQLARVMRPGGLFYFNVIGPAQAEAQSGEEIVTTQHERDTVQSYFDAAKIARMVQPHFDIVQCQLHSVSDAGGTPLRARWHVVCRRAPAA